MKKQKPKTNQPLPAGTVNCHVRFPRPVYNWLQEKANPKYKTVQQQVIEIVLAVQEAEKRRSRKPAELSDVAA